MSHSNPHRRQRKGETNVSGTVKTLATTAVVVYGAYKAYQFLTDQDSSQDHVDQDQSFLSVPRWLSSLWNNDQSETQQQQQQQQYHRRQQPTQRTPSSIDLRTRHRLAQQSRQNCRHKVLEAYTKCWPAILQVIEDSTNTVTLTQELRTLRQQQQSTTTTTEPEDSNHRQRQDQLWKQIQQETITKFVTTIYASSLLFLSLTMQLHWINGQVFHQQQQQQQKRNSNTTPMATNTREAQHLMMQTLQYMTVQGIPILIAAVRRAVTTSTLEQYQPTTLVTRHDIDHALDQMEQYLEKGTSTYHSRNWIRMVLPDPILYPTQQQEEFSNGNLNNNDDDDDNDNDDNKVDKGTAMLEAWWDLAESPAWQDAQQQTIHFIRRYLHDKGWGRAFPKGTTNSTNDHASKPTTTTTTGNDDVGNDIPAPCQVPLAKLMAPFKASTGLVQGDTPLPDGKLSGPSTNNTFFRQIQSLATVLELGDVSFQE